MQFTEAEIEEFKELYYQEYGERISTERAIELASKLITLLKTVLQI